MRKKLLTCLAGLGIALYADAASAQFCVQFDLFCDGLELFSANGEIEGEWVNYDCNGSREDVEGDFVQFGTARILCGLDGCGNCAVDGEEIDWGFILDGLDGTLDVYVNSSAGVGCSPADWDLSVDELTYTVTAGACPFLGDSPFGSSTGRAP